MKYDYETLSDEELFILFSKSREVSNCAFNEIYKRYSGKINSFLYKILGDKQHVKDLFQDVFTKVYIVGAEGKKKKLDNFKSYLYSTVINSCSNHFKSLSRRSNIYTEYMIGMEKDKSDYEDTIELVRTAVNKLPEHLKEVFILYEYEELNYPAIAEITGDTQVNVRVKIHRARKMIKDLVVKMRRRMTNMV
ncbi:MAG: hypothetical protein A2X64_09535 [Ignavibacteria bacterium GWF2_33_9]|nr:MAG: hypothetical protein A2X64_09535 [Ignavibacteria bacterium GWF2_33_9]